MRAIRIHHVGGPEAMRLEEVPQPEPALAGASPPGSCRCQLHRCLLPHGSLSRPLPLTPGMEGAGVVEAAAPDVSNLRVGDRVAYAMSMGSYAEHAIVPAWMLVPIPDTVGTHPAAAAMLQGMTAHYLARSAFPLREGHTALVHAAAGGSGFSWFS